MRYMIMRPADAVFPVASMPANAPRGTPRKFQHELGQARDRERETRRAFEQAGDHEKPGAGRSGGFRNKKRPEVVARRTTPTIQEQ